MKSSPSHSSVLSAEIRPSRSIYCVLALITGAAIAAAFYAALPLSWQLSAALTALAYGVFCCRQQARQRGWLHWREGWSWLPEGDVEQSLLLQFATVWPGLMVLGFRDIDGRRALTLALWRDSLDEHAARRLRVLLRHAPVFDLPGRSTSEADPT